MLSRIAWSFLFIVAALVTAHLVFRPPSLGGRTATFAVEATSSTTLGRIALAGPAGPKPSSGVVPLLDGTEAFAARVGLIRTASVALDVQYYIWQRDATGLILLDELRRAADRGVRVRLLIDDNGISGMATISPPSTPCPTSKSASSIRSSCGPSNRSAMSSTSCASIGACTTSR